MNSRLCFGQKIAILQSLISGYGDTANPIIPCGHDRGDAGVLCDMAGGVVHASGTRHRWTRGRNFRYARSLHPERTFAERLRMLKAPAPVAGVRPALRMEMTESGNTGNGHTHISVSRTVRSVLSGLIPGLRVCGSHLNGLQ